VGLVDTLLAAVGVLVVAWIILVAIVWLHRPSRALAGSALRLIPDLIRLTRALTGDPATPVRVKVVLVGLLIYLVSPIDLIPDFIPVLGSVDDLAITALVLRWAGRRVGTDQVRRHWAGSPAGLELLLRLLGVAATPSTPTTPTR
jgi:uncharacterized membrane protein YkvA (DUF1232 family)